MLLLYTGLPVEELEALDIDDVPISARRGKVIVRDGKGGTYREVPAQHSRSWPYPQRRAFLQVRTLGLSAGRWHDQALGLSFAHR